MDEFTIIARLKANGERYIFIYDDQNRTEVKRELGRMAMNSELSFTWLDAANIAAKMRGRARYKRRDAT